MRYNNVSPYNDQDADIHLLATALTKSKPELLATALMV